MINLLIRIIYRSDLCDLEDDDHIACSRDDDVLMHGVTFFRKQYSCIIENGDKSHVMQHLWEASHGEGNMLESEILTALVTLVTIYRHGEFTQYHTIPVSAHFCCSTCCSAFSSQAADHNIQIMVCTFQHDKFARLTQAHWDGRSLIVRQSRLLDLRGDEPTNDAYLLLRWMLSTPIGQTGYENVQEESKPAVQVG